MSAVHAETLTLDRLNALDHDGFVRALGEVFEHSPWVAEAAWARRPFADEAALHAAMMAAVRAAPRHVQTTFLNAHPELAGREAQAGTLTEHSAFEQQRAGLDALDRAELQELRDLNAAYAARHGFPFILNVLGHTRAQIFAALRERCGNATQAEIGTAFDQIEAITRRRLRARFAPG